MLHRTEEAKFSLRKECVNCPDRLYKENTNEQNRHTTDGQESKTEERQDQEGMKEHNKFKELQVV